MLWPIEARRNYCGGRGMEAQSGEALGGTWRWQKLERGDTMTESFKIEG